MNNYGRACGELNIKQRLDASDQILVSDRSVDRSVSAAFFLSQLVTAIERDGDNLVVTFADKTTKEVSLV